DLRSRDEIEGHAAEDEQRAHGHAQRDTIIALLDYLEREDPSLSLLEAYNHVAEEKLRETPHVIGALERAYHESPRDIQSRIGRLGPRWRAALYRASQTPPGKNKKKRTAAFIAALGSAALDAPARAGVGESPPGPEPVRSQTSATPAALPVASGDLHAP